MSKMGLVQGDDTWPVGEIEKEENNVAIFDDFEHPFAVDVATT